MISGALKDTLVSTSAATCRALRQQFARRLGCEVIKVELPNGGDTHRGRNPKYEGYGPSFRALNRNKKSVTLNLREKKARRILLKLLARRRYFPGKLSAADAQTARPRLR
jgi:hypothetical protein